MAIDLAEMLKGKSLSIPRALDAAPFRVALVTMEIQRGVCGDLASFPALREACEENALFTHVADLSSAFRAASLPVVHCTAYFRADRAGSITNSPLHSAVLSRPAHLLEGSAETELVPEIDAQDSDLVSARSHGVAPFIGTNLHALLNNLGVKVIVAVGVSVNIGIQGLCIEAIDHGYQVVLPTDCVAGTPRVYADEVIKQSLSLLATLTTSQEIIDVLQHGS